MTNPYVTTALAHEYQRERIASAQRGRLAALARCCNRQLTRGLAAVRTAFGGRRPAAARCA